MYLGGLPQPTPAQDEDVEDDTPVTPNDKPADAEGETPHIVTTMVEHPDDIDQGEGIVPGIGGKWGFEVKLVTSGILQIGWANADCVFEPEKGGKFESRLTRPWVSIAHMLHSRTYFMLTSTHVRHIDFFAVGVGDDGNSYAFDGSRCRAWHGGAQGALLLPNMGEYGCEWRPDDCLTVLFDVDSRTMSFWLNGEDMVCLRLRHARYSEVWLAVEAGNYTISCTDWSRTPHRALRLRTSTRARCGIQPLQPRRNSNAHSTLARRPSGNFGLPAPDIIFDCCCFA